MEYPKNRNYMNLILNDVKVKVQMVRPNHYSLTINDPRSTIRRLTYHKLKRNLWQVYFWDKSSKKQIFLQRQASGKPLRNRDDCESVLCILASKGYDPKVWNKDRGFHFDKALEFWLSLSTCSPEWLQQRRQISNRFFIPHFGKRDIRLIKTMDINSFVAELKKKGLSDKSLYNVVGELKAFFNFHKRSLPSLPDFPRIKFQLPKIRSMGREDQNHVFEFIPQGDLPIFTMLKFYGCRENEASGLLKENVVLEAPKPHLIIATALSHKGEVKPTTKTRRTRVLPVPEKLLWVFDENGSDSKFMFTRNHRPYSNKMLNATWNKANKSANEKYGTPIINLRNATRHSWACQKLDDGFPMHMVKTVLGHSDSRTTERYGQYSTQALEDIIEGEIVHTKLIPRKSIQPPGTTEQSRLGGEDSNLGSKIQSLASCR